MGGILKAERCLGVLLFLFLVVGTTLGAEKGFEIVETFDLKKMVDEKKEFTLIDARSPEEYAEAHVVGAINIPANEWDAHKQKLPKDKNRLVVTYCNGVQCGKSFKAAGFCKEAGFKNILVYKEGYPVWEEVGYTVITGPGYGKKIETRKLTPSELAKVIGDLTNTVVVDVRDPKEFQEGHIKNAINVPIKEFATRSGEISKKKRVVVYCNTGSRSYLAYKKLVNMDYKNIYQSLLKDWKSEGHEVITAKK